MPKPSTAKADTQMLLSALRVHYVKYPQRPAGIFATEIQAPGSSRRADALWLPLSVAGGTELVGHEVKVTRSDLLRELGQLDKADGWSQHCDRWYLVVPTTDLLTDLTIPEPWGVLTLNGKPRWNGMRVVKDAPQLTPVDQAAALRRILTQRHYGAIDELTEAKRRKGVLEVQLQQARDALAQNQPTHGMPTATVDRIVDALRAYEQAGGSHWLYDHSPVTPDDFARTLVDLEHARRAERAARQEAERIMDGLTEPFSQARQALQRVVGGGA